MDDETLFDVLFVVGLVALGVLNVARWAAAHSRDASWNEARPGSDRPRAHRAGTQTPAVLDQFPGHPCAHRAGGRLLAVQALVAVALAGLVLLRYFGVWPKG